MGRTILVLIFSSFILLTGCGEVSEIVTRYHENYEITGSEKEAMLENLSDTIYDSIDRGNSDAEEVVLDFLDKGGNDVTLPEGRYLISGGLTGTVEIRDKEGLLLLSEVLAPNLLGVDNIMVDMNGSNVVHVDGFESVSFTPVETIPNTDLSAGIWEVGKDIEAGEYTVTGFEIGFLQVFEKGEEPQIYEIIGGDSETDIHVVLKDGQKLKITGLKNIHFERVD